MSSVNYRRKLSNVGEEAMESSKLERRVCPMYSTLTNDILSWGGGLIGLNP